MLQRDPSRRGNTSGGGRRVKWRRGCQGGCQRGAGRRRAPCEGSPRPWRRGAARPRPAPRRPHTPASPSARPPARRRGVAAAVGEGPPGGRRRPRRPGGGARRRHPSAGLGPGEGSVPGRALPCRAGLQRVTSRCGAVCAAPGRTAADLPFGGEEAGERRGGVGATLRGQARPRNLPEVLASPPPAPPRRLPSGGSPRPGISPTLLGVGEGIPSGDEPASRSRPPVLATGFGRKQRADRRPLSRVDLPSPKTGHRTIAPAGRSSPGSLTCPPAAKGPVRVGVCRAQRSGMTFRGYSGRINYPLAEILL